MKMNLVGTAGVKPMSLKKLLGLDAFPLSEEEIMARIEQAYRNNRHEIEFQNSSKHIKVSLSDCIPLGVVDAHEAWGG